MSHIATTVSQMQGLAAMLTPYTYPRVIDIGQDLSVLKLREVTVDGTLLMLYYSVADYIGATVKTLTMSGKYLPIVSLRTACKIAAEFFPEGDRVRLIPAYRVSRLLYTFMLMRRNDGNPIPAYDGVNREIGGFKIVITDKAPTG